STPRNWLQKAYSSLVGLKARRRTYVVTVTSILVDHDQPPLSGPGGMLVQGWPLRQRGRRSRSAERSRPRGECGINEEAARSLHPHRLLRRIGRIPSCYISYRHEDVLQMGEIQLRAIGSKQFKLSS